MSIRHIGQGIRHMQHDIQYVRRIKSEPRVQDDIRELLRRCDAEFIPPLSTRRSTTRRKASQALRAAGGSIDDYFDSICDQQALVAFDGGEVVGFMSFREDYICVEIPREMTPNIYITTVIVHPDFRGQGIAREFYRTLTTEFQDRDIFVRTWSTNTTHVRILTNQRFEEHRRLANDRGEGIDTVFYRYDPQVQSWWQIIQRYHLEGNILFLILLVALTVAFLVAWVLTPQGMVHELAIAFSTSLIASALCLLSDTVLKYNESKNDEFLQTLKGFGIERLLFRKDSLLESILPRCSKEIWISGYRLIMTGTEPFLHALSTACRKHPGIKVRVLVVAPWSETFRLVYGEEDVSNNYLKVFYELCRCQREYGTKLEIRVTNKPIFNDTYKVDNRFVTGPYLHSEEKKNKRTVKVTAKDFFSLDINDPKKRLYELISKDYTVVWDSAHAALDCGRFYDDCDSQKDTIHDFGTEEKLAFIREHCASLQDAPAAV